MLYKLSLSTLFILAVLALHAQDDESYPAPAPPPGVEVYSTSGGDLIFSFADVSSDNASVRSNLRFSAFFHIGEFWHFDFTNSFGMFTGVGLRNVGIITKDDGIVIGEHTRFLDPYPSDVKIKRRSYSLGVPLAFKIGNLKRRTFVYAGGEAELMFHYKEKLFIDGDKEDKFNEWFSDRTNIINPSLFGGIQLPGGLNVKFKYYLLDFLNPDYAERIDGVVVHPYQGLENQMFYISLAWNLRNRSKRNIDMPDDRT
ncbi:MAG: hypothetical protein KDC66_18770 [Phaeodactylibacter sp.]|nr:hypothetical protein [Phaeodactylibacter sp.]